LFQTPHAFLQLASLEDGDQCPRNGGRCLCLAGVEVTGEDIGEGSIQGIPHWQQSRRHQLRQPICGRLVLSAAASCFGALSVP
jgi:hypothetical protein